MAKRGQNEGSIYQRKDGRWCAVLSLGWQCGKFKRRSFYGETRKEVQEQLTQALSDHAKGLPGLSTRVTVGEHLAAWLEDVVARTNRPSTHASYEWLVGRYIAPALGRVPLAKLTPQQVRALLNKLQDSGLSSRTVQYVHAVLRRALNVAVKDETLARNAAALVDPPRGPAKEVQPLTPDQARRFLEAVSGDRLEGLYVVSISLGLRQGEALGLRWRDIDLEAGTLRVRYALQRHKTEIHLVEPKTKKSRRLIELPRITASALAAHRMSQDEERTLAGSRWTPPSVHCEGRTETVDDLVFTSTIGTPLEASNVGRGFQRRLTAAGLPRHRYHDLRHTAATLLVVQGVHAKVIQSVLGWDQLSMVDRYTHFVDEMRKDAATKMDAILSPVAVNVAVKTSDRKVN